MWCTMQVEGGSEASGSERQIPEGVNFSSGASPHSVWTSLSASDRKQGGGAETAAPARAADSARNGAAAAAPEGAAAAEARRHMVETVSGVMEEATRLASDIASAGEHPTALDHIECRSQQLRRALCWCCAAFCC
jgi:hypothetical protein